MKATLSELAKQTAKVVAPAIHGRKKVTLTYHGQAVAEIVPLHNLDKAWRRSALEALRAIGPVDLPSRK